MKKVLFVIVVLLFCAGVIYLLNALRPLPEILLVGSKEDKEFVYLPSGYETKYFAKEGLDLPPDSLLYYVVIGKKRDHDYQGFITYVGTKSEGLRRVEYTDPIDFFRDGSIYFHTEEGIIFFPSRRERNEGENLSVARDGREILLEDLNK